MPVATHTLVGDFSALVGEVATIRATIHTNSTDDAWVNDTDDEIRLGGAVLALNASGEFTVTLPTSTGTGLQYQVSAEYVNADRQRKTWQSGWFDLTADADLADKANDSTLRINTSLGDQLAARIDGVDDHGNVTGTLVLDPANTYHVFDATGPTTVEIGNPPGYSLAFKAVTGADQVTVEGLPDLTLADNAWSTFVHYRGAWDLAASGTGGGGGTVEPITDPPTQPGEITVDPTSDGYNLTWVASTVAAGYEGSVDGGTYTDYGTNLSETLTGYASGSTHSGQIRAYNSVGQKSTPRAWGPATVDTVGLHEQILALEPLFYYRMSRGSKESFGTASSSYSSFQYGTPSYAGPALMDSETGSLYLSDSGGPWLGNPDARPDLDGLTDITVVALLVAESGQGAVMQANGLFRAYFSSASPGSYSNEYARTGVPHLFAMTGAADGTKGQWRDGVKVDVDNQGWTPGGTLTADSEAAGYSRMGGTPYGGAGAINVSHIAVIPSVLTGAQLAALAQAAGTFGSPA